MKLTPIEQLCIEGTAMAPRKYTDRLFQLPAGSVEFTGWLMDSIRFIEDWQLLDAPLWALFVNQFRSNVDDHDNGWRCEYWGKLMRGASFVYACTKNETLYDTMVATIRDLMTVQEASGRVSTYSEEKQFNGWDLWGRKYILLGLQYFLEVCKDETFAQEIIGFMMRHADYIIERIGPADEGKIEINTATTHWDGLNSSSILEPFVRLYSLTGEERYLEFADYIVERGGTNTHNLFEQAYEGRLYPYEYHVTKAYEMMSCFEGLLEYYRITGVEKWRVACENISRLIAKSDVTLIGCSGCTHELFDHSAARQLDTTEKGIIQETCVTVTWMKFCYQLLCMTGDSFYADHMETSLYNALIGSINTEKTSNNKGLPFDSYSPILAGTRGRATGGYKTMENGTYYGCCACIGAAGLGLAGMSSTMLRKDGVAMIQYLNGTVKTVTPAGNALTLTTETAYPVCGKIGITVSVETEETFALYLRVPAWSENTSLTVNGEAVKRIVPGNFVCIRRSWKNGDTIALELDMRIRQVLPEDFGISSDAAPFTAFCRGPLVLARDVRLGQDIDAPVYPIVDEDGCTEGTPAQIELAHQLAIDLPQQDGSTIRVIDYASAGKSWDENSRMAAWLPVK